MTPSDALITARDVIAKCRRGSNSYLVLMIDGRPHVTRDNSTIACNWEVTGQPPLIGKYNRRSTEVEIAGDILRATGGA